MAANDATLTWNLNGEGDLAGYNIYYGQYPGLYTLSIHLGIAVGAQIGPFSRDGTWYFAITAYDTSNNESAKTSAVSKRIINTAGHLKLRR